jgi:hypothetical protein
VRERIDVGTRNSVVKIGGQITLGLLLVIGRGSAVAQTATDNREQTPLLRDPAAVQQISRGLVALGGAQNVGRMDSCVEEATRTSGDHSSSVKRFNVGDDYRYEVTLDGNPTVKTSRHTYHKETHPSAGSPTRETVLVKQNMRKGIPSIPSAMPVVPHLAPAVLLRRMLDSKTGLELIPAPELPPGTFGILMKKASPVTKQIEEQRWYFDSATNLPVSVSYWLPTATNLRNHIVMQVKLEDFGTVGEFTVPRRVTTSMGSMTLGVESVSSLRCQQTLSSDLFTSEEVK